MRKLAALLVALAALFAAVSPAIAQAPPPVPALPDTERRTSYAITAQTGPFDVSMQIYGTGTVYGDWIEVWLDGVKLTPVTQWTLSLTSGTLATAARPLTNARVTLTTASTGTLQIVGARRPTRTSQFSENQGVSARSLNQIFTDLVSQNRETWDKINDVTGRILVAPPGEFLTILPPAASRANTTMGFNSVGQIVLLPIATIPSGGPFVSTGSISALGADANFNAGGNRAFMDFSASAARIGSVNGGGSATSTDLYSGGFRFLLTFQSAGIASMTWNEAGSSTVSTGLTSNCTSNLCAGGILAQRVTGNYQTTAYHMLPLSPSYLPPAWGPMAEFVTYNYASDDAVDYNRFSFTGMSGYADPSQTIIANDFRVQGEAAGSRPMLPLKISNQHNTTGHAYGHMWYGSFNGVTVTGFNRMFPERFYPADSSENLALVLGQYKSSNGPTIVTPSTQGSPAIWLEGNSLQSSDFATFTGTITGTALTFPSATGTVAVGQTVAGTDVLTDTVITAGAGLSWTVSKSQTKTARAMTSQLVKRPTFQLVNIPTTNAGAATYKLQFQLTPTATSSGWADIMTCTSVGVCTVTQINSTTYVQTGAVAVASLPTCNAGAKGARHFVTDANAAFTAGIGAIVAAGGANNVPVTCDGTNWRIG